MVGETDYNKWTKAGLVQRLMQVEAELKTRPALPEEETETQAQSTAPDQIKPPQGKRKMDPSKYSTRYIALKLAYLGKNYGGFEFQAMANQASIEEELWKALTKSCLVFPDDERVVQFDCCEYSKCGRTDRGVSAFGQVVGLRVRSNRPVAKKRLKRDGDAAAMSGAAAAEATSDEDGDGIGEAKPFDDIKDELCYPRILNRILPKDIRILAWCPTPPTGFSARFSCRERQYRYFFTQPAFAPEPLCLEPPCGNGGASANIKPGWLDIAAMRDAAKRFEGEHDFRNFCKMDPSKQMTNFRRRIFESDIVQVEDVSSALPYLRDANFAAPGTNHDAHPKVFYFHVRGSAFLWHQIRHMVAILFLVGQGLESPSLVTELLDVKRNPCRPGYVMADEVPLVLWDCIFPREDGARLAASTERKDALEWIYIGDELAQGKLGQLDMMEGLWELWRERKMDELLANQLLQHMSQQGAWRAGREEAGQLKAGSGKANASTRIYEGGNSRRLGGRYVPVMKKALLQSPEEQNERYARRKGYASAEDMRAQKGIGGGGGDEGATSL